MPFETEVIDDDDEESSTVDGMPIRRQGVFPDEFDFTIAEN
jgi:hypothetical protein